jgi:hypothetical protein
LSISILFTGCHSYYVIQKDNYDKIETIEDIKIVYTDGKEFVVEKNDTTYAKVIGDSLIVNKGLEKKIIQMSEVEKIKENRFDLGGTITISLVALTILVVLFFSMDPFKT